ncbi:hypothetical protein [Williamsia sterculiae]|uniref:Excreted virulence factor EspC, type VII ESX diderm n=1 Tax=Williamsia sterculiae TaxID=1344003 RepID=A0A1N7HDZ8_9NOCA|nr:hypothetical protein [Williamsia sterculiae]SIS23104.1 hypothetical protein SAMN05445060_4053 [Williamsia sterculiae]
MATNEQHRQVQVAQELSDHARTLAHSTRDVPSPSDSYRLLGELNDTITALEQVCRQLARWHAGVIDGIHYDGQYALGGDATGTITAAGEIHNAAAALHTASDALSAAHAANGVVRWFDTAAQRPTHR